MSKQEEFIKQIKNIKDYWLKVPDKTTEEVVDGVLFSVEVQYQKLLFVVKIVYRKFAELYRKLL